MPMPRFALVMGLVALSVTRAQSESEKDWSLYVTSRDETYVVTPGDGKVRPVNEAKRSVEAAPSVEGTVIVDRVVSPDGKWLAYETAPTGEPNARQIALARGDGTAFRVVTTSKRAHFPSWSPGSDFVVYLAEKAKGDYEVRRYDLAAGRETVITREPIWHLCRPGVTADGRIVYVVFRGREGKQLRLDLILGDGESGKVLAADAHLLDARLSPDRKRLAYSTPSGLTVAEVELGTAMVFRMEDVNAEWHVSFRELLWRPDGGALAVGFGFLGGRTVGTKIAGEDHVGILRIDQKKASVEVYRVAHDLRLEKWSERALDSRGK